MKTYHKIQSVWLRDPENKYRTFLEGQWSIPEFQFLSNNRWIWTEKVDGTNIRVQWDGEKVRFGGRTERASIPTFLLDRLQDMFPPELMKDVFPDIKLDGPNIILCGEGYGNKIQKAGKNYNPEGVNFILFDVLYNERHYLERASLLDIALKLKIHRVPVVGQGTLTQAIEHVQAGFDSAWGAFKAEGLVLRPEVELCTRTGDRVITKIKAKDFE